VKKLCGMLQAMLLVLLLKLMGSVSVVKLLMVGRGGRILIIGTSGCLVGPIVLHWPQGQASPPMDWDCIRATTTQS
jgi:hypothetical protein